MKERYEEVQRFGRYHPDYNIVMKSIRIQKRELDMNEQVAALRLAENDVQHLFDEVGSIVAKVCIRFSKSSSWQRIFYWILHVVQGAVLEEVVPVLLNSDNESFLLHIKTVPIYRLMNSLTETAAYYFSTAFILNEFHCKGWAICYEIQPRRH